MLVYWSMELGIKIQPGLGWNSESWHPSHYFGLGFQFLWIGPSCWTSRMPEVLLAFSFGLAHPGFRIFFERKNWFETSSCWSKEFRYLFSQALWDFYVTRFCQISFRLSLRVKRCRSLFRLLSFVGENRHLNGSFKPKSFFSFGQ